jgi:hypothetical protein
MCVAPSPLVTLRRHVQSGAGRGSPLFGVTWADGKPSAAPIDPQPVKPDLEKAIGISEGGGEPDGFSTTFSFNVGQLTANRPPCKGIARQDRHRGRYPEAADAQMSTDQ